MLAALRRAIKSLRRPDSSPRRSRLERFGAICQLTRPRALVFVDRTEAEALGVGAPADWDRWPAEHDGAINAGVLSAPLEAHLQLTNRCSAGCTGCYTGSTAEAGRGELDAEAWKRTIDHLAELGVFHLALGGGESAELPWLGEVAAHARSRGLIPNLTTSGLTGLDRVIDAAHLFGQINVSLDGLGATYAEVRGFDGFDAADRALIALRQTTRHVGVNVVVTRKNFDQLGDIFAHARRRRLNEVELLRFKPSGRGATAYAGLRCTDEQHRALLPMVLDAARRHRVRVKLDCSYTPMIAHHRPGPELLGQLAVYGCVGGDFLIGVKATGQMSACSFASTAPGRPAASELGDYWSREDAFPRFRSWREAAEPCRSCDYLELCRGGCRAVSRHVCGDEAAPDPECPRVVDHRPKTRLPIVS